MGARTQSIQSVDHIKSTDPPSTPTYAQATTYIRSSRSMVEPDPIVGVEPPPEGIPLPGQGIGTLPSRLDELPSANVTGFCIINSRGIGSLDLLDLNSTIVINLLVFVFLLLVFERCRHIKSVYFPRYEYVHSTGLIGPHMCTSELV